MANLKTAQLVSLKRGSRDRQAGISMPHSDANGRKAEILEIGRKAFLAAFGRKIWHLEPPKDTVGGAKRRILGRHFGRNTPFRAETL